MHFLRIGKHYINMAQVIRVHWNPNASRITVWFNVTESHELIEHAHNPYTLQLCDDEARLLHAWLEQHTACVDPLNGSAL